MQEQQDQDQDQLLDVAEEVCGLDPNHNESSSDQNHDGITDHQACMQQERIQAMFDLQIHPQDPYAVEFYLFEPVHQLREPVPVPAGLHGRQPGIEVGDD